jgi:signal transduction histidine kinase
MENQSYTYGMKMTGLLLHLFFTIVLTISVFLLGSLLNKSILQLTDIGTEDFLGSGYYLTCIEQKCVDLSDYMQLTQKGEERTAEDDRRYLQYTNEFRQDDTNFCYWYKENGKWYTNQPDTKEGQQFDTQTILMEAKTMGDYLLYDMEEKEFGTDIRGLDSFFFSSGSSSYNDQMYWPLENAVLVIGVDTELPVTDDLYEASVEYARLHPWIKISIAAGLISLMGWILTLVYLTLAAGHMAEGEEIRLNFVDKIKTEILVAGFLVIVSELMIMMAKLGSRDWDLSGLLVASGTISFLVDVLFLIFYLSMVRRLKAEAVWETSFACWLIKGTGKVFKERKVTTQTLVVFMIHMALCILIAIMSVNMERVVSLILFLIMCGVELYFLLRRAVEFGRIREGVEQIVDGDITTQIPAEELHGEDKRLAEAINNIGSGLAHAVDDSTRNERMKADLITNVSHDIKTPLTSIINYVNLIKLEEIDNENVKSYINILDEKSQRLKQLIEDLVEASKVSSGNVRLDMRRIDIVELIYQTAGEFNEKFEARELTIVTRLPQREVPILADGRRLYRVIENLYNNVSKYALEKTRVYVEVAENDGSVIFTIKNVSERSLAIENGQAKDLTERFVRGDTSRTTEGSGLGLSIAKNLTVLMGGQFEIDVDGDLFKVTIIFPEYAEEDKGGKDETI